MNTTVTTRLVTVLALGAAWMSVNAVAAPQPVQSQAQLAAQLDGNAFLDTGTDSSASASWASEPKAALPASAPHKAVAASDVRASEKRVVEETKRKPAFVPAVETKLASHDVRAQLPVEDQETFKGETAPLHVVPVNATQPTMPVIAKPSSGEAVVNPMTGEELSTEDLRTNLTTSTLRAEIAQQNYKAAQAESQISQLRFMGMAPSNGPLPPKAITLADVPKPIEEAKKAKHHVEKVSAAPPVAAAPPALAQSPVTGIMTQENVRYALLQLDGKGEMARAGQTVDGRRVDTVSSSGVTLDGHFYPVASPVTEIASVDPVVSATGGAGGAVRSPVVYGSVTTSNMGTPNPFAHNANGGLPPLPGVLAAQRGQ